MMVGKSNLRVLKSHKIIFKNNKSFLSGVEEKKEGRKDGEKGGGSILPYIL